MPVDDYLAASPLPPDAPRYWDRYDEPVRPPAYRDRVGPGRLPNGSGDGPADGVVGPESGDQRESAGRPAGPLALTSGAGGLTERHSGPVPGAQAGSPAGTGVGPVNATTSDVAGQEDDEVTAPLPIVVPGVTGAKPDTAVSADGPVGGFPAAPSPERVTGSDADSPGPASGLPAARSEPAASPADPIMAGPAAPVAEAPDGESVRGPFEPLRGNGSATPVDPPGAPGGTDQAGSPSQDPVGVGQESGMGQSEPEAEDAAAAKLDQIKDLYLTAEAIGDDALAKHFQQVSERQRQLIREYFDEAIGRGAEDRASG